MQWRREDKVRQLRIMRMDELIRRGDYPNASVFCSTFEVSRATVMRDIAFMKDQMGAPIAYDTVRRGFYYTDVDFFVKSVRLSEGELFSLSVIKPLLDQYRNTPLGATMQAILSKIAGMLPQEHDVDTAIVSGEGMSFIPDPLPHIDEDIFTCVFAALRMHRSLRFSYQSLKESVRSPRFVDPYHVVCHQGNWYLLAFDHDRGGIRTFSFSRMEAVSMDARQFTVPDDFDPNECFDRDFGVWNNGSQELFVELEFSRDVAAYVTERQWHHTQTVRRNADGSVYVSFKTNQVQEVLRRVLGFGPQVRVLGPQELVEAVRAAARAVLAMY